MDSQSIEHLTHAISGAGGGMISMALTYPLITIGTRMQIQKNDKSKRAYKGFLDAVGKILHKQGVHGFYAGLDSALFGIALTNGVYYYCYEHVKALFMNASGSSSVNALESLLTGAVAGCATVLVTNPVWVVNTRVATGKGSKTIDEEDLSPQTTPEGSQESLPTASNMKSGGSDMKKSRNKKKREELSTAKVLMDIVREDGVLSLWQGVWPALVLVANPSIQYMVYEQLKNWLSARGKRNLTAFDYFMMGALSKLVATFLTYPYIVVKSRMQLKQQKQSSVQPQEQGDLKPGAFQPVTTMSLLRQILKDEGVKGLYKGLGSKLTQSVLTAAILFWAKESLVEISRESLLFLVSLVGASMKHSPFTSSIR